MMQDLEIKWDGLTPVSLTISESSRRHIGDIIQAQKGHYKFSPLVGVGAENYLIDETGPTALRLAIRSELEKDGATVLSINVSGGEINVSAEYE